MATVLSERPTIVREWQQSWHLHSGELVIMSDDDSGVEMTAAVEEGYHLVLSHGDVAELVMRLTEILHRRLP